MELYVVGLRACYVVVSEICLWLVQSYMQGSRARSLYIPVNVLELRPSTHVLFDPHFRMTFLNVSIVQIL